MRAVRLLLLLVLVIPMGITQAQTPVPQPMPEFVLRAAQALNAQYGPIVDLNNVVWDYTSFGSNLNNAVSRCPNLSQPLPPLPANTLVYIVELKPVHDGLWGDEIWNMLVYGDYSTITACTLPPTPTPSPTVRPPATPLPPAIIPTATITVTPANCPGALLSRLSIGQQGRVTTASGFPNNMRAIPGTSGDYVGEIPPGRVFTVLEGPRCASNFAWWQVNYNGLTGWTPEGDREDYWLEPAISATAATLPAAVTSAPTSIPTAVVCNPNALSRLRVGQMAQVTPGMPNNLRAAPGQSGQYLGEIPPGQPFLVLAGPQCASGMAWWQVDYNGMQGWTPEGETADDYWLEPLVQTITASNIMRLRVASSVSIGQIPLPVIVPQSSEAFTAIDTTSARYYSAQVDSTGDMLWQTADQTLPGTLAPTSFAVGQTRPLFPILENDSRLQVVDSQNNPVMTLETGPVVSAMVYSDHPWIVTVGSDALRVWDGDGTPLILLGSLPAAPVSLLRFSGDGSLLAASGSGSTMVWNTDTWTVRFSLNTGIERGVMALSSRYFAISPSDQTGVTIYDLDSAVPLYTLASDVTISALALNTAGDLLATADSSGHIQLWDAAQGTLLMTLDEAASPVRQIHFTPADDAIFALADSGILAVWMVKP